MRTLSVLRIDFMRQGRGQRDQTGGCCGNPDRSKSEPSVRGLELPSLAQPQALLTRGSVWGRKEILREYLEISSLVQDEVVAIHREMAAAAARIQPEAEYQGFLQQYG